jgi:hypothetical protein
MLSYRLATELSRPYLAHVDEIKQHFCCCSFIQLVCHKNLAKQVNDLIASLSIVSPRYQVCLRMRFSHVVAYALRIKVSQENVLSIVSTEVHCKLDSCILYLIHAIHWLSFIGCSVPRTRTATISYFLSYP